MRKLINSIKIFILFILTTGYLTSCVDFFNPDQGIDITEEQLYSDWYEYRAAAMGMYSLQQDLVEQILVLGELRGDLLTVTENADQDLMEIYNFNVSRGNKYASPQNFFKLIAATNRMISILEHKHPSVTDMDAPINNYDRLYGEALTMRAWAYFNAARIYGEVPFIDQRFSTVESINEFLESPTAYTDSILIIYGLDGYSNDTIRNQEVVLERNYFDVDRTIRHFAHELETKVKAVGVNHYMDNEDNSWEVTIWSQWSYETLLGHMYLTLGDLAKSAQYFETLLRRDIRGDDLRYQLTDAFAEEQWMEIFKNIDRREHILTLEFNKQNQQQHSLQRLFLPYGGNDYMLKPTSASVHYFETQWRGAQYNRRTNPPDSTRTINPGTPSDYYRGFGISYVYVNQNMEVPDIFTMLEYKRLEEPRSVESMMQGVDTIVYKYTIDKGVFESDANYIIYRAGGVNLYLAEIYIYWRFFDESTNSPRSYYQNALNIVNNGSYYNTSNNRDQLGVRGRVGLPGFTIQDDVHVFDPFTNEFSHYYSLQNNLRGKQLKLENELMEERARELAYEGERFYDLMRVAKRRGDPAYLADRVSAKYPAGMREHIRSLLMDEQNWYINYFE